jgi:hypothetical protein
MAEDAKTFMWVLAIIALLILVVGILEVAAGLPILVAWYANLALMSAFVLIAGRGITGRWRGAFIDERNKVSLSRLQMLLWTVVVLSAYLAGALARVAAGTTPDPLAIAVPDTLWMLLGISTTSLVGSPLIKGAKAERGGSQAAANPIDRNKSSGDARWIDVFKGEDTSNFAYLDMAKVQMFFFTLVLVFAYTVLIGRAMAGGSFNEFPALAPGMVALLGISHAGYLTSKAVPRNQGGGQ